MMLARQRNYKLVLPISYVEVNRDEMEYIDGGGFEGSVFYGTWTFRLSSSECSDISNILYGAAGVSALVSAYITAVGCPGAVAPLIVAGLCGVGGAAFGIAANHGGFKVSGMQLNLLSIGAC